MDKKDTFALKGIVGEEVMQLIAKLQAHLKEHPGDFEGLKRATKTDAQLVEAKIAELEQE